MIPLRRLSIPCLPLLFALWLGAPSSALAERGVVWLTAQSEGEHETATLRVPLEWIATIDRDGHSEIRLDDETMDCTALWLEHKDLPIGESREVGRGVTKDGDRYVAQVVAEKPSSRAAEGKVHILTWDHEGEKTDLRFPLDLAGLMQHLGRLIGSFLDAEPDDQPTHPGSDLEAKKLGDLMRLADYGPFTFLQLSKRDGSRVRISIE